MKPLKRPMFRSGGPIKEGIMDGMKEPQAINTVGSPVLCTKDARMVVKNMHCKGITFNLARCLAGLVERNFSS